MERNQETKRKMPEAFDAAFIAVLAQNAYLFCKPINFLIQNHNYIFFDTIIISISIINLFNITSNWIVSRGIKNRYTNRLIFWDVLILSIYFIITQSLIDLYGSKLLLNENNVLVFIGISYSALGILYIIWNKNQNEQTTTSPSNAIIRITKKANIENISSISCTVVFTLMAIFIPYDHFFTHLLFVVWLLIWGFIFVSFIYDLKHFE